MGSIGGGMESYGVGYEGMHAVDGDELFGQ